MVSFFLFFPFFQCNSVFQQDEEMVRYGQPTTAVQGQSGSFGEEFCRLHSDLQEIQTHFLRYLQKCNRRSTEGATRSQTKVFKMLTPHILKTYYFIVSICKFHWAMLWDLMQTDGITRSQATPVQAHVDDGPCLPSVRYYVIIHQFQLVRKLAVETRRLTKKCQTHASWALPYKQILNQYYFFDLINSTDEWYTGS